MSTNRFESIRTVISRKDIDISRPGNKISEYFASNVFHRAAMQKFLSDDAYESVVTAINRGSKIDRTVADQVASSIKSWAISKGATHFTHWFQPLTGATAEKHDTFFSPTGIAEGIEKFSGDALVQQEPDASSFPSGGLRATFEARGYTAWDPSSPAFIIDIQDEKTLCIPTIFVSYNGEALDYKAPLLKSAHELNKAAVDVCNYFDRNVKKVTATLGWEQEYFLIDESYFYNRPDLVVSGRTLFGHTPSKGQQLEDHYFGSIPERVYRYMVDFETEAHKLGIPLKTRHNEVAPGQFECAPVFEEVNLAIDHNQMLMDLMNRVARRHKLKVLFHEKPFAGINGSGKHNNWSMQTDTGKNLLAPGKTPKTNLQFLTFFINTIKAVHDYNDLIRSSIASAGNDHRLGANEAPPAIISVFIGSQLTRVLHRLEKSIGKGKMDEQERMDLRLEIHKQIPDLMLDNTDRNRTSPFAFTGNKFEFRAVGSSANCAEPMIVLNSIMAKQLIDFKQDIDTLVSKGAKKEEAILKTLQGYIKKSKRILFEGDNYSESWKNEAKKRGLNNITDTPRALDYMVDKKASDLFSKLHVFDKKELEARHEIMLENFIKKIQIESRSMGNMTVNHIIPAAIKYQNLILENINNIQKINSDQTLWQAQEEIFIELARHIQVLHKEVKDMINARRKANKIKDIRTKAIAYGDQVRGHFSIIRYHADKLELLVDDRIWPLAKYREMLFIR